MIHPAIVRLLASSSDVTVDVDPTFLAQFLLFAVFVILLKPLLFDPLLRVFEERERRTEGAKQSAREMDAKAGELGARYEEELEKVRAIARADREVRRAETARLEARLTAEARAEAAKVLEAGKAKIAVEVAALRGQLEGGRPDLAERIAARVLGSEVPR